MQLLENNLIIMCNCNFRSHDPIHSLNIFNTIAWLIVFNYKPMNQKISKTQIHHAAGVQRGLMMNIYKHSLN